MVSISLKRRAAPLLLAGALAGALLAPVVVSAHIDLLRVDPAPGILAAPPQEVALTFTGPLDFGTRASVLDVNGAVVSSTARIDTGRTRLVASMPDLGPSGAYTLSYTTVSEEDGHTQPGFAPLIWGASSLAVSWPERDPLANLQDVGLELVPVPTDWGDLQWHARVAAPDPASVTRVLFRFKPLAVDTGEMYLDAWWAPDVSAYVVSHPIALSGPWQVIVSVRRANVPDDVRALYKFSAS